MVLDYIPTRYPDAYAEGSPHEYYDDRTAREAQAEVDRLSTQGKLEYLEGAQEL